MITMCCSISIKKVDKENLKLFIDFPDILYKNDDKYVPYMKRDLYKTLKDLIIIEKTYTGLLALNDCNEVLARVLFTIDKSKQLKTEKCGFFSMYECVDDTNVSNSILSEMKKQLIEAGAEYIVGTFFPFDQDNRRGIMVKGFERAPLILTSYNHQYYNEQLTAFGFLKQIDTFEYEVKYCEEIEENIKKLNNFVRKHYNIRVDKVDFRHPEKDIKDICDIMKIATNEIVYQEAPSEEVITKTFHDLKPFLNNDYILIARRNQDDKPIGFIMAILDYFEIIKMIKGNLNIKGIVTFLLKKKNIKSLRCMLQYVIPEYQKRGALAALFCELYESIKRNGIEYVEAGTILENNTNSNSVVKSLGGEVCRIYRLYYMKTKDI